jgi:cytochrome P450
VSEPNGADAGSIELSGAAFFNDPYPAYARLRGMREPVYNEGTHAWMITRFADVESVLRDPRISKKIQRATATAFETSVLFRDPPDHGRIRGLLNQVFAGMPEDLDERVRRIADGLIDRMKEGRKADFMRDFALPLPVAVIAEVLGIPAGDMERLHGWSAEFIIDEGVSQAESDQRQYAAICGMDEYFRGLISSGPVGGMIGAMLRADPTGDKLSQDELIGNCILLMVAGHETTVNLLGNGLYLLLQQRERLERVKADPKLLPIAIEETLRYESPVQLGTFRVTAETVEIGGRTIEAGALITAVIGAANRDPEIFADPDTFDLGRTSNRHLGFGFGPHRCIGAQLARSEARVGFARLFERLPNLALDTVPPTWLASALQRVGLGKPAETWPPHWRHTAVTRGLVELKISL